MHELIHNILRGSVSTVMYVLLLFTLTKSRFGPKTPFVIAACVFVINMSSTLWFYLYADLTSLSRFTILLFLFIGLALKHFTRLNFFQWSFTFLTTINIAMMIIIISFHAGKLFPDPQIANTLIRFFLYLIVIILFKKVLNTSYQSVVNNWAAFSFLIVAVFINLSYYFYATEDIQITLSMYKAPLLLLVFLCLAAYGTVFFSLRRFAAMYALEAENLTIKSEARLLHQAASTMAERLQLMENISHQHTIDAHDRRHFNNMLLELLEREETKEAEELLRKQNAVKPLHIKNYCENKAVNAVVGYYADLADRKGISTTINLTLEETLTDIDSMELALVVSNLFENAINGVMLLDDQQEKYIHLTCLQSGRLVLEILNPCLESVILDTQGFPVTNQEHHGFGTASIRAFCNKYEAELMYQVMNGLFRVRILL